MNKANERLLVGEQCFGGVACERGARGTDVGEMAARIEREDHVARGFDQHAIAMLRFGEIALNAADAQRRLDARKDFALAEWFGDVVVGAGVEPVRDLFGLAERGHHDDRDVEAASVGAHTAADFKAVEIAGQHHVEQDQIDVGLRLKDVQRVFAGLRAQDTVAVPGQHHVQHVELHVIVVDDEDGGAGGHAVIIS